MSEKIEIVVRKYIKARREKVFEAWTHPEIMQKWFCPENLRPGAIKVDLKVGGAYSGVMLGDGVEYRASGVYQEITPHSRLVFTHGWDEPNRVETLVCVDFFEKEGGTELVLTHSRFVSADEAKGHQEGWASTLDNLAKQFDGR